MQITVNGEQRTFAEHQRLSVAGLVEALGLGGRHLAVEVNRRIVRRGTWDDHHVCDGDVIEIVHFVGGGS